MTAEHVKSFAALLSRREKLAEAAGRKAKKLVIVELQRLHQRFPRHRFVFYTGMDTYEPFVTVTPKVFGQSKFSAPDFVGVGKSFHPYRHRDAFRDLEWFISAMSDIVVYAKSTFGIDIGRVELPKG